MRAMIAVLAWGWVSGAAAEPSSSPMKLGLEGLLKGKGDWSSLSVTYNDRHTMHGGLRLTVLGSGRVIQEAEIAPAGVPRRVSRPDLKVLVLLLMEKEAWRQEEPGREPAFDEPWISLTIRLGGIETKIRALSQDGARPARIRAILTLMKQIAWEAPPDPARYPHMRELHSCGAGPGEHCAEVYDARVEGDLVRVRLTVGSAQEVKPGWVVRLLSSAEHTLPVVEFSITSLSLDDLTASEGVLPRSSWDPRYFRARVRPLSP